MQTVKHFLLLCVIVLQSQESHMTEPNQDPSINFPMKALQVYQELTKQAKDAGLSCYLNHAKKFPDLKEAIDWHWQSCLTTVVGDGEKVNLPYILLLACMQNRAKVPMDIMLKEIADLHKCIGYKEDLIGGCPESPDCEAEWAKAVEEVKFNLTVNKKNSEFYVAVENAKLADNINCYNEFLPMVDLATEHIENVVNNCIKFVPKGSLDDFKKCCSDLSQPIQSDIEAKLRFVVECTSQYNTINAQY